MADLHPVKLESFQIAEQVNVDPKGFTRPVDQFSIQRGALYMARPADHPRFHYLESWLYPSLDIRVTWFHFREQARKDVPTQEMYVDIATVDIPIQTIGQRGTSTSTWSNIVAEGWKC